MIHRMALVHLIQHAQKQSGPGDPRLTALGHEQARRTALRLSGLGIGAVYSSPLARARQTAQPIAAALGVPVVLDNRLRERMNWDGRQPLAEFLSDWDRANRDRAFVPPSGDSSHRAAARLIAFLQDLPASPDAAVVTHGGVTIDALRTLAGDEAVADLTADGMPACAVTTVSGLRVLRIADVAHLRDLADPGR
jgi:broad specificity phosphatase PhoE